MASTGRYVAEIGITKVQKLVAVLVNIRELNKVDANSTWPDDFRSGAVLKIQFKKLKTGDTIMILFKPRYYG